MQWNNTNSGGMQRDNQGNNKVMFLQKYTLLKANKAIIKYTYT